MTNIATAAVVMEMIGQLNNGFDTNSWGVNIFIGIWVLGLAINWTVLIPMWARIVALIWAIVFFVDGFVHIFANPIKGQSTLINGPLSNDFVDTFDNTVFIAGFLASLVTLFAVQAAFRKSANSG